MASGQDGQFLKLDRTGKVLGAIGNGMGIGTGQFIEASYWAMASRTTCMPGTRASGASPRWLRRRRRSDEGVNLPHLHSH
jgi:hypothetical protein